MVSVNAYLLIEKSCNILCKHGLRIAYAAT